MSAPVEAVFYDGLTGRPRKAFVTVAEPSTLQVDVLPDGEDVRGLRILWPLEHEGMAWERTHTTLRLSFGDHPRRIVLVRDLPFIQSFAIRMRHVGRQGVYDRLLQFGRRVPVLFVLVVLALLVSGYLWGLPWAVERLALALPTSLDESLGETMYAGMTPALSLDSTRSGTLQRFGDHLNLATGFRLTYHVVDADEVNAFALPGGHIVVYTGLLDRMDDPGQLVALLAHEATHVHQRHSTRAVVRELSGAVFLALVVGDAGGVAAAAAGQGDALRQLGYSRHLEAEADALGMEHMAANGVDPQGMVLLLRLLEREAQDMPEGLSFLSSHPLTTERIAAAEEKAKALGHAPSPDAELERLFEALKADE